MGTIEEKSAEASRLLRDMDIEWMRCKVPMGRFIGPKGSNLRATARETGCFFYGKGNAMDRKTGFMVYYPSEPARQAAKRALGYR
jgi:hypothetical protein